ncbi:MAG TPA: hypothetical protein VJV74_07330 [Terriglobia bacterium]|nr:hypothetical protein [Terriglobia bacterium]
MKRVLVLAFLAVFVSLGAFAPGTMAQEKAAKAAAKKEVRWDGYIVRDNPATSTLDVRRKNVEKRIHYSDSTKWTKGTGTADKSEFKENSRVICLGTYDEKGEFQASRIDLRSIIR